MWGLREAELKADVLISTIQWVAWSQPCLGSVSSCSFFLPLLTEYSVWFLRIHSQLSYHSLAGSHTILLTKFGKITSLCLFVGLNLAWHTVGISQFTVHTVFAQSLGVVHEDVCVCVLLHSWVRCISFLCKLQKTKKHKYIKEMWCLFEVHSSICSLDWLCWSGLCSHVLTVSALVSYDLYMFIFI